MLRWLKWFVVVIVVLALVGVAAGQIGLLQGRPPADLGVRDGRLKAPSATANSVSSQALLWPGREAAQIEPLPLRGSGPETIARLKSVVEAMPGAKVVEVRGDYLYAQFTTRLMKYVDDTEFWFDPVAGVVQVRSASRLGEKDFNVNRERVEAIRLRLAGPDPSPTAAKGQ